MTTDMTKSSPESFVKPTRRILTSHDLELFRESPTKQLLLAFVKDLGTSVEGKKISDDVPVSENVKGVITMFEGINEIMTRHPPVDNSLSRFGNPAFRSFYEEVEAKVDELHKDIPLPEGSGVELYPYLLGSFGSPVRIDYGSGHELSFLAYLLALTQLPTPIFIPEDYPSLVLRVFHTYLSTMRQIQSLYLLEPAGSHGVWGLDDYHFLPFLLGAHQLAPHRHLKPRSIHDADVLEAFAHEYFYLGCIKWINETKTVAGLRWHSPMLDDISGVKTWRKVAEGMGKMYDAEVLSKLPIMQHFMFGTLVRAADGMSEDREVMEDEDEDEHGHQHGWGDCCGIKVPSAIAARQGEEQGQLRRVVVPGAGVVGGGVRRLPFD
ncbi:Serine/threonine-protein phosphatase 2A activator 2 [Saitoella coloradoensis]